VRSFTLGYPRHQRPQFELFVDAAMSGTFRHGKVRIPEVYLAPSVGGLVDLRVGGDCQKAIGARLESVQNSANSQCHSFEKNPILEGFSNFNDGFTDAETCNQLNLFDF